MSTCQTWATSSHFRHPWFDATAMKRKRRDNDTPSTHSPPASKRRRHTYAELEDGFSYLSVNGNTPQMYTFMPDSILVEEIPTPATIDADMSSVSSQPVYSVEEPTTIPEVKMKTSSWYELEPDRMCIWALVLPYQTKSFLLFLPGIVITDLDSFTESDDEDEHVGSIVNPPLLEKIRANTLDNSPLPPVSTPSASQALVLFRPLPRFSDIDGDGKAERKEENRVKHVEDVRLYDGITLAEDAMDIGP